MSRDIGKIFYYVMTDGNTWRCLSPFSDIIVESASYSELVFKADIQLMIGLPHINDLILIKNQNGVKTYKAFIKNTMFNVSVHRIITSNMETYWGLKHLNTQEEIDFKMPYKDFRDKIEKMMGLKLPKREKSMELSYEDRNLYIYMPFPTQRNDNFDYESNWKYL